MSNTKETNTTIWLSELAKEAGLTLAYEGANDNAVSDCFKTASKSGSGKRGFPDATAVQKDFLIIIENKKSIDKHIKLNEDGDISLDDKKHRQDYAVNGAVFYGKQVSGKTSYKKIFVLGISGVETRHKITPFFIGERGDYYQLDDLTTLISFSEQNIEEYYIKEVLKEATDEEKTTEILLKDAAELHEHLRNYGHLTDNAKPLIVSGILLALEEVKHKTFAIDFLNGDDIKTDGEKVYNAIESCLSRANVQPTVKKDKILRQFAIIKDNVEINQKVEELGGTPIKLFTEFLYEKISKNIRYIKPSEDILGRFYSEFMSYSGGDGQTLGIVLTPSHICDLFCDLVNLKPDDVVFDPCCGTGGFLVSAMHYMIDKINRSDKSFKKSDVTKDKIKKDHLHGVELQDYMFTIATTNMIIRGDGKSNLINDNFLKHSPRNIQKEIKPTIGMINPPYSQGNKSNHSLYEINFIEHLLKSVVQEGKVIAIVPQSTFTGKTKEEQNIKTNILKYHTLEGVITLNKNTFYGVGTNPCIAVFTAGIPHNKDKLVKFINFEDDGFEVQKHKGLVETSSAKDKKAHLLDVWNNRLKSETKFCVETTIEDNDEWLHSFYYFNDEIPSEEDFKKTIADYLTFEVNMITHGRGYLFEKNDEN